MARYTNSQDSLVDFFNNDLKILQILYKAQAEFNRNNFDQVIELLEPILNNSYIIPRDKLYIIDILASIVINYGEMKYLDKADKWSFQAMGLASDIKTIQGTRGAILIELGRYSEGKEMLLPLTEAGNEAIDILTFPVKSLLQGANPDRDRVVLTNLATVLECQLVFCFGVLGSRQDEQQLQQPN